MVAALVLLAFLRDYKKGGVCARDGEVSWYLGLLGFSISSSHSIEVSV